jgi:hypothetical protein
MKDNTSYYCLNKLLYPIYEKEAEKWITLMLVFPQKNKILIGNILSQINNDE